MGRDSKNTTDVFKWTDVKERVIALNPMIGQALDEIPGVDNFDVIRVRYPFGMDILKKGVLHFNLAGHCYPWNEAPTPKVYGEILKYSWQAIPFGMVMENSLEAHIVTPSHVVPMRLLTPGNTFGLQTLFDDSSGGHYPLSVQNLQSGCRSLLTLVSLGDREFSQRLVREYGVREELLCPKTLAAHWALFCEITRSPNFIQRWHCEIILFSKDFMVAIQRMTELREKLVMSLWRAFAFERNQFFYELVWSMFEEKNLSLALKNSAHVVQTVKHLIRLRLSNFSSSYVPAIDNLAGPIEGLMHAFAEVYKVRFFSPIMMRSINGDRIQPTYYSMQNPVFLRVLPEKKAARQAVVDTIKTKEMMDLFQQQVLANELPISLEGTALQEMLKTTEFTFYHPHAKHTIETNTQPIFDEDPRFAQAMALAKDSPGNEFSKLSTFFYGCVRVRPITKS